jgi:hypothetical protein
MCTAEDGMKVRDLIDKLKSFDPDTDVVCYSEDEGLKSDEGPIQLFEIMAVSDTEAEKCRLDSGRPWLKFEKSEISSKITLLEVTSDF